MPANRQAVAARKLTLAPLVAAIFFIVAGGPYGLEDIVSKAGYAGAILILLLTPLLWAFPTALMVSELSSALPEEGGYYVWVRRAMGRFWGFQEAWLSFTGSLFDMAIYPTLFVEYLGAFAPSLTANGRGFWLGAAMVAGCAAWNLAGARKVGIGSLWMGALLLAPFACLTALALFHRAPASAPVPLRNVDFLGGVLVAMWNYMGWDNASTIAGEVDRPHRTYPLAMLCATILIAAVYVIPVAAVAMTGLDPNAWATGGWANVARAVLHNSPAAAPLALAITAGGVLGAVGTMNALTLALTRVPAVLAEDGFLPRVLTRRNPRTDVPWVAVLACSAVWALCLNLTFSKLILLDVLLTGLSILLEFAALVTLRIREPNLERPYRVPGGLFGAVAIGLPPLALLALTALRNKIEPIGPINALQLGVGLIALGVGVYFVSERVAKRGRAALR
jgi:amino acid transporter